MTTQLYREQQLWSGNEGVEIRYVSGSSVAGTSASSPGVPRHISNHNPESNVCELQSPIPPWLLYTFLCFESWLSLLMENGRL